MANTLEGGNREEHAEIYAQNRKTFLQYYEKSEGDVYKDEHRKIEYILNNGEEVVIPTPDDYPALIED